MELMTAVVIISCFASPVLLALCAWLGFAYFRNLIKYRDEKNKYEAKISVISRTAQNAVREAWFEEIQQADFSSELEVESKFVYPMLKYLGYHIQDIRMRVSVIIRVGRQDISGIADWVVYQDRKPAIVIEAKDRNQSLNEYVKDQARSYCFALNCPMYILTNGCEVQVYRRGVDSDMMIFNCETRELPEKWSRLYEVIGAPNAA